MKRLCFALLCALLTFPVCAAESAPPAEPVFTDFIVSSDGKYEYGIDTKTHDAYFSASLETDITTLRIPDEIDGKPIVGVWRLHLNSPNVTRIEFGRNIRMLCRSSLAVTTSADAPQAVRALVLNEGLQTIADGASDVIYLRRRVPTDCAVLTLPRSLAYIGENGLDASCYRQIVLQSDPQTKPCAVTSADDGWNGSCSVILTTRVEQMDAKTFSRRRTDGTHESDQGTILTADRRISLYASDPAQVLPFKTAAYTDDLTQSEETAEADTTEASVEALETAAAQTTAAQKAQGRSVRLLRILVPVGAAALLAAAGVLLYKLKSKPKTFPE